MTGIHLHLAFAAQLLCGIVGMALSDGADTFETIAKARGRALLAGVMDGAGDIAGVVVQIAGIGSVLLDGISWRSVIVITGIFITSVLGTTFWTRIADRHIQTG